jgi:hypothetical protein
MRRIASRPLPLLLLLAACMLGAATVRAAHMHDAQQTDRNEVRQCDLCHGYNTGAGNPAPPVTTQPTLQPLGLVAPVPELGIAPQPLAQAHRPRGPPAPVTR